MAKELVLSNGTKIRITPVSPFLLRKAIENVPEPDVPMWHNPDKDRDEPNPIDPDYIKALEKYKEATGQLTTYGFLAGVHVMELGEYKHPLDSDDWVDECRLLGVEPTTKGALRKIDWLQYHVIESAEDLTDIIVQAAASGGLVSEEDVQLAASTFQPNQDGGEPAELPTEAAVRLGDTPEQSTRDDQLDGVQGSSPLHAVQLD
jgi:hypothetical protein